MKRQSWFRMTESNTALGWDTQPECLNRRSNLEDLQVDGRIILKFTLRKYVSVQIELNWLMPKNRVRINCWIQIDTDHRKAYQDCDVLKTAGLVSIYDRFYKYANILHRYFNWIMTRN
jgi:hypothetical protein